MAPFSLMTAGVSWLAKSFTVFSSTSVLTRCTGVLPASYINSVKCLSSQPSGPPKRPLNGYMRFLVQQHSVMSRQNPEIKVTEMTKEVAQKWRMMSPEQKQPYVEAYLQAKEQFNLDIQRYKAQLTPEELQQQAQENMQRLAKRKAYRQKKELINLGKPKRSRSALNIFMSDHFEEARGTTTTAKFRSLMEDWRNLFSHQKKVYTQLAEDDKIRYKNEMKSWEDHMVEIGRDDLIRERTRSKKKKALSAKKATKKESERKRK